MSVSRERTLCGRRGSRLILGLLAFVVVSTSCNNAAPTAQPTPTEGAASVKIGDVAPSFALSSADGKTVSSSDYHGKPVLLYFGMGPG